VHATGAVRGMLPALVGAVLFMSGDDVCAQSIYAGVKGGISIPSLRGGNSEISEGYSSRMGPDAGIYMGDRLSDAFAVQVEALYSCLEVPVVIRYSINTRGSLGLSNLYVDAGPYVGFLLSATNRTGGVSSLYLDKSGTPLLLPPAGQPVPPMDFTATTDVSSDISNVSAGITGGIGFEKSLGPGDIVLDARGAYGLKNIQTDPKNGRNNTGNFVIALGYELQI